MTLRLVSGISKNATRRTKPCLGKFAALPTKPLPSLGAKAMLLRELRPGAADVIEELVDELLRQIGR